MFNVDVAERREERFAELTRKFERLLLVGPAHDEADRRRKGG